LNIVNEYVGGIAGVIAVSKEFYSYRHSGIRRHVNRLLDPRLVVAALVKDRLEDRTRAIGDVSVLPVE
jgi:hypothetical protein